MSYIIAVAGKGGTGKSTISSIIIRYLLKNNCGPILAVDADPNANLADSIGIELEDSISSVLSDFMRERMSIPHGMTKQSYLEMKLHQILKEEKDIDMLSMGCPEGSGCYCSANAILKSYFEDLNKNYKYVVFDNEAGMEHLSRKTAVEIDLLLFCSNYSMKGIKTISRLTRMVNELKLHVKEKRIIINQTPEEMDDDFKKEIDKIGIPLLGHIPVDKTIEDFDLKGRPLTELPDNSKTVQVIDGMLSNFIVSSR